MTSSIHSFSLDLRSKITRAELSSGNLSDFIVSSSSRFFYFGDGKASSTSAD